MLFEKGELKMPDHPLISEDAEPLHHLIGNEYQLGWRSVWIHTPQEAVRIEYRDSRIIMTVVRKNLQNSPEQHQEFVTKGVPVEFELNE
jgi:hypothetical protein